MERKFKGNQGPPLAGKTLKGKTVNSPTKDEVRTARKAAGLTLEKAAGVIYSKYRTWQDWESGKASMHAGLFELFMLKTKKLRASAGDKPSH